MATHSSGSSRVNVAATLAFSLLLLALAPAGGGGGSLG